MRKKQKFVALSLIIVIAMAVFSLLPISALASIVTKTWSGKTQYVPSSGVHQTEFKTNPVSKQPYVISMVDFTLNSANVTYIVNQNTTKSLYFGMQVRSVRDSGSVQRMDAYQVISSLPNPYYDLETNTGEGGHRNEAEAIALGTVTAKTYWMNVYWNDYRQSTVKCSGGFKVTAEMSKKSIFGEYNAHEYTQITEVATYYGNNPGKQ